MIIPESPERGRVSHASRAPVPAAVLAPSLSSSNVAVLQSPAVASSIPSRVADAPQRSVSRNGITTSPSAASSAKVNDDSNLLSSTPQPIAATAISMSTDDHDAHPMVTSSDYNNNDTSSSSSSKKVSLRRRRGRHDSPAAGLLAASRATSAAEKVAKAAAAITKSSPRSPKKTSRASISSYESSFVSMAQVKARIAAGKRQGDALSALIANAPDCDATRDEVMARDRGNYYDEDATCDSERVHRRSKSSSSSSSDSSEKARGKSVTTKSSSSSSGAGANGRGSAKSKSSSRSSSRTQSAKMSPSGRRTSTCSSSSKKK